MLENNNNRIAKNTAFLYIRMAIVLVVSLYTTRVVLAALGVVDYGVYNVVCGFVTLFSFLNATMSNSIQRYFNYEMGKNGDEAIGNVYVTSLMIQLLIAVIVVLLLLVALVSRIAPGVLDPLLYSKEELQILRYQ